MLNTFLSRWPTIHSIFQYHRKGTTERGPEYEAAPLLLPKRGSRRTQFSNGSGIEIEEKTNFDRIVWRKEPASIRKRL
jgi:hypothetical protein